MLSKIIAVGARDGKMLTPEVEQAATTNMMRAGVIYRRVQTHQSIDLLSLV